MEKTFYPFSYIKAGNTEIRTILYSTIDQIYFTIELSLLIQKIVVTLRLLVGDRRLNQLTYLR